MADRRKAGSCTASILALGLAACDASPGTDGGPADADPDGTGWRPLAALPMPIQETGVAAIGNRVYVVGGFAGFDVLDQVHVYDIAADRWDTAADLPMPIHHANVAAVGGKLYVVGALTGQDFAPIPDVWEYDPAQDEWIEKAPMPSALRRGAAAAGTVGNIIYVAGGSGVGGGSVATFTAYDPGTDTHDTTLPDLPDALNHLVGAGVGDTFYAIGGRDVGIVGIQNRCHAYDPVGRAWTECAAMPTARGGMAAGVVDGAIIVVGGEGNTGASTGVFPQAERYDPGSDSWTSLDPMRTPRHGMGAAGVDGVLYVPGGGDVMGFGATEVVEALVF